MTRRITALRMPMIVSGAAVGMLAEALGWSSGAALLLMLTWQLAAALAYVSHEDRP
jgi:hypothetical protein